MGCAKVLSVGWNSVTEGGKCLKELLNLVSSFNMLSPFPKKIATKREIRSLMIKLDAQ